VLGALGIETDLDPDRISACIREAGIGFMFAPNHHAAMRHVGPARSELGVRTIFNLLGPLSNPASVTRMLVGVFAESWVRPIAETLRALGAAHAWVVHSAQHDEITTSGLTLVGEVAGGALREFTIEPEDFGLPRAAPGALKGGDAAHNAAALRGVLEGRPGTYRDVALLNAAAGLVVADVAADLGAGLALATQVLDSGAALDRLERLIAVSNG
jgi:anthranilate phosphoribosyltransferase